MGSSSGSGPGGKLEKRGERSFFRIEAGWSGVHLRSAHMGQSKGLGGGSVDLHEAER